MHGQQNIKKTIERSGQIHNESSFAWEERSNPFHTLIIKRETFVIREFRNCWHM